MSKLETLEEAMDQFQEAKEASETTISEAPEPVEITASSDSETDVKETVASDDTDDSGVPWKNRAKELERKVTKQQEELKQEIDSLKQQLEESASLSESQALNLLKGGYVNAGSIQSYQRPAPQAQNTAQAYTENFDQEDPGQRPVTIAELQKATLKQQQDVETYQRYKPYLDNKNSPLVIEVTKRLQQKAVMGFDIQTDPFIASETVAAAYGDLVSSGKLDPIGNNSKKEAEAARRKTVDAGSLPSSGRQAPAPKDPVVSQSSKNVLNAFKRAGVNIDEKEYSKRKTALYGKKR